MDKKSAKKSDFSEKESDDADRSSDPTQEEEATDSQSEEPDSPAGNVRKAGGSGAVQASAVGGTPSGQKAQSHSSGEGYVNYERGSDPGALSARYGMDVRDAEAGELQRLEREFGRDRVNRWVEEGMTVETMGKPRDMQAFRARQEERSEEIPTDIERRNEASLQRNASGEREDSPAGETGVPDVVRSVVSSPGRSMDETVQREMESKMGGDFSDVQLHTGQKAAAAADSINARAFTVGNHIAFNKGEYQPKSTDGKKVLAHELTHVRQQTDGAVSLLPKLATEHQSAETSAEGDDDRTIHRLSTKMHIQPNLKVSSPDDPAEREAERVAERVVSMSEPEHVSDSRNAAEVNRETDSEVQRQEQEEQQDEKESNLEDKSLEELKSEADKVVDAGEVISQFFTYASENYILPKHKYLEQHKGDWHHKYPPHQLHKDKEKIPEGVKQATAGEVYEEVGQDPSMQEIKWAARGMGLMCTVMVGVQIYALWGVAGASNFVLATKGVSRGVATAASAKSIYDDLTVNVSGDASDLQMQLFWLMIAGSPYVQERFLNQQGVPEDLKPKLKEIFDKIADAQLTGG